MKTIQLNTAAATNTGKRAEAGSTIGVGRGAGEIDSIRASALVARGGATAAHKAPAAKVEPDRTSDEAE